PVSPLSASTQAVVRVLDQQVADREPAFLGLGGEPLCQLGRDDDGASDAIVALPYLVGGLRQVLSFGMRLELQVPRARRSDARRGRSGGRGNSGWESPAPE